MPRSETIWNRTFVAAMLLNFGVCSNFFLLVPVTVLLVQERYDASVAWGGLAAGALLFGAVTARPFCGLVLARIPDRTAAWSCALLMAASAALCLLPLGLEAFVALRVVAGWTFALSSTAAVTIAMSAAPESRRGSATGWFGLSNSLPAAVGPAIGLLLARSLGYDAVIWAVVVASLGAAAAAGFVTARARTEGSPEEPARGLSRFLERRVLPVCAVIALVGIGNGGIFSFVDSFTLDVGVPGHAPAFFVAFSVALVAVRPLSGRAMDSGSPAKVFVPALALLASGLLGLSLFDGAPRLAPFLALGLLCGAGMGMVLAGATVMAIRMAPPGRLAVTVSTYYMALDSSVGLGPVLLGMALPAVGFSALFALMGSLSLLSLLLFLVFLRAGLLTPATRAPSGSVRSASA